MKQHAWFAALKIALSVLPVPLLGCSGGGSANRAEISPTATPATGPALRVACVGDSITSTGGANSYPSLLGRWLGKSYQVRNYGVSGATVINRSGVFYQAQEAFTEALRFKPDTVTVALGTNDSREFPFDATLKTQFQSDYQNLITEFRKANPSVKIYLCLPVPSYPMNATMNLTLSKQILPLIRSLAVDNEAQIIDLYTPLSNRASLFPDGVHPNTSGTKLIANQIYQGLTGKRPEN